MREEKEFQTHCVTQGCVSIRHNGKEVCRAKNDGGQWFLYMPGASYVFNVVDVSRLIHSPVELGRAALDWRNGETEMWKKDFGVGFQTSETAKKQSVKIRQKEFMKDVLTGSDQAPGVFDVFPDLRDYNVPDNVIFDVINWSISQVISDPTLPDNNGSDDTFQGV